VPAAHSKPANPTARPGAYAAFRGLPEAEQERFWQRHAQLVELRARAERAGVVAARDDLSELHQEPDEDNPVGWRTP
jgi:protein-disulfide isomerase